MFILCVFICVLEVYSYNKLLASSAPFLADFNKLVPKGDPIIKLKYGNMRAFNYNLSKESFKITNFGQGSKRPIIFFGCSFAKGFGLEESQTLAYKISKLTNRKTYNRSACAWGSQHVLYQLRRDDFKKDVPDAEYIIYTFIYGHLNRLFAYNIGSASFDAMLRYKLDKNGLTEIKPIFLPLYSLFTVRYMQDSITNVRNANTDKQIIIFNSIMNECLKLSRKKYKNCKFVILVYKESFADSDIQKMKFKEDISQLKKSGFIIVDAQELVGHNFDGKEYLIADGFHPSEKAWSEIAPELAEYLKL